MTSKKLGLPSNLEFNIVYGCNLNCDYCTHFAPYMTGYVEVSDIELWCQSWCDKLLVPNINILGGEPLLHPNLEEVIEIIHKYWSRYSTITLVTNGLTLHNQQKTLFQLLRKKKIVVIVSQHHETQQHLMENCITILEKNKIECSIRDSYLYWHKCYQIKKFPGNINIPLPYNNKSHDMYSRCRLQTRCVLLMDNKLYHCGIPALANKAYQMGFIQDLQWQPLHKYQPATIDLNILQLRKWWYDSSWIQHYCWMCKRPEAHK